MSKSNSSNPGMAVYDFYKSNGSDTAIYNDEPSMTRQEFADECDINTIMRRYEVAGATINGLPRDTAIAPFYADFTRMPTNLLDYMAQMDEANAAFMTLPATVRREFDNSAVQFVDFASDPENLPQMRSWGLAPPLPEPPMVPPATSSSPPAAPPPEPPKGS